MRVRIVSALLVLGAIVCAPLAACAQEKPDAEAINKKKTLERLEKAKDEYRIYFKKPESTVEYWSAIKFEMDLGKFDLAALHLKRMLGKDPDIKTDADDKVDKDLVDLEQAEGMSAFLRLRLVRQWSDHPPFQKEATEHVDLLIERATKAIEKHLSHPDRIKKFIKQLDAPTEEERAFAYVQLARSRERAVPYLIEALRVNYGKAVFPKLRETILRMGPETVPVYLEVFKAANDKDYRDIELRLTLLDIIQKRDDRRVVPYLWHMYASKKYPDAVRKKAKDVLASLLRIDIYDVPGAKESLAVLAERYYQHKVSMPEGKVIQIWPWDGEAIALKPVELTPYQAEEFFGLRYARESLDLDTGFQPAQVVLLSLMLERQYKPKMDQALIEPMPPKMQQLLTTIDPDLVLRTMERGMDDRQVPVILPLIQALGERGEFRAARASAGMRPTGLVRALYYPDRRVQFAAMLAMLRMPANTTPAVASDRMVELTRRFVASEPIAKALVVAAPKGQEADARQILKDAGLEAVLAGKAHEALEKGRVSADYDLVILHRGVSDLEFPHVFAQLRNDNDLGGLPMLVIVDKARLKAAKKFAAKDASVLVLPDDQFKAGDELKSALESLQKTAQIAKLAPAERKLVSRVSMDILWRMARGEIQGYNVQPAVDAVIDQLRNPEYAVLALEILGRSPGKEVQFKLAGIVGDANRDIKLRIPASLELNRHIQNNGLQLDKKHLLDLKQARDEAAEGSPLRNQLNVTASLIARSPPPRTGVQLFQFRPDPPAPPKDKEDKKDN